MCPIIAERLQSRQNIGSAYGAGLYKDSNQEFWFVNRGSWCKWFYGKELFLFTTSHVDPPLVRILRRDQVYRDGIGGVI
jgi:hypothetical protein